MTTSVEYRVLGALDVYVDGAPVIVSAAKQRIVLATLALNANRVVPADDLVRYLWDEVAPANARTALQNYVMRLRRTLGTSAIATHPDGYLVSVTEDELDLCRFDALVRQAEALLAKDPERAATLLGDALGLWRGQPLSDVPSERLHRDLVPMLNEKRLRATELRVQADLQLGRHRTLIAELRQLTARHPLRERFWAQLMLALHRSSRPADTLDAYRQARTVLARELGAGPGQELRDLHAAVLTDAPELARQHGAPPINRTTVPRQLLAPPRLFTGRETELRGLDSALGDHRGERIAVVDGASGIGKTWLALHWAHRNNARFPDGQLYVHLHGTDQDRPAISPSVVLRGFLEVLGVASADIPAERFERAALYREVVAERQLLIVLDDAKDSAQVRPLLPDSRCCATLVTARRSLGELVAGHGAAALHLDVLNEAEARRLTELAIGADRMLAEPDAVATLLARCAGHPFALGALAAQAAAHPDFPLGALIDDLEVADQDRSPRDVGAASGLPPIPVAEDQNGGVMSTPRI